MAGNWFVETRTEEAEQASFTLRHEEGGPTLVTVRALAIREKEAGRLLRLAVAALREQGTTWEEIAQALGVTRQAASARFGRDDVRLAAREDVAPPE